MSAKNSDHVRSYRHALVQRAWYASAAAKAGSDRQGLSLMPPFAKRPALAPTNPAPAGRAAAAWKDTPRTARLGRRELWAQPHCEQPESRYQSRPAALIHSQRNSKGESYAKYCSARAPFDGKHREVSAGHAGQSFIGGERASARLPFMHNSLRHFAEDRRDGAPLASALKANAGGRGASS